MSYFSNRGSIIIALLFIMILSITAVAFLAMLGGRATLTANQLKRAQAINCAEAALYEAFNRFRAGQWNRYESVLIFNNPLSPKVVIVDGVNVIIRKYADSPPFKITATVSYKDIRM